MQLMIQSGDLGPSWFHLSIRTLVILAEHQEKVKSHFIAERLDADSTTIRKILSKLSKSDFVASFGGRYGGYQLIKAPNSITIKDIYNAIGTDSPTPYWSVPQTGTELYISNIVQQAEEAFQAELNRYTLDDVINHKIDILNKYKD